MDTTSIAIFSVALLLNAGTPGPRVPELASHVLANSWRDVFPFLVALWLGEVLWLSIALAGLTALAQTYPLAFTLLKWIALIYFTWLAFYVWYLPKDTSEESIPSKTSALSMFCAGLAIAIAQWKIVVFYLALLPFFINIEMIGLADWAVLSCVTLLILASADLSWTFFARKRTCVTSHTISRKNSK